MNKSKLHKEPATFFVPPAKGGVPRVAGSDSTNGLQHDINCNANESVTKKNAACSMDKTPASFPAHGQLGGEKRAFLHI
jgi:hypothetical protein